MIHDAHAKVVHKHSEEDKKWMKIARSFVDATANFLDKVEEDTAPSRADIEAMQAKIAEFGRLVRPVSPSEVSSHHHHQQQQDTEALEVDSPRLSVHSESLQLNRKKKKGGAKKKPKHSLDYSMIGVDLASMMVEIQTELVSCSSGASGAQGRSSIDTEIASQSSIQGCLLLKALRTIILDGDEVGSPQSDVSTSVEMPTPRSSGGVLDTIVAHMVHADIFRIAGDDVAVSPLEALLFAYSSATQAAENSAALTAADSQLLAAAIQSGRQLIEDYIAFLSAVIATHSGHIYVTGSAVGKAAIRSVMDLLVRLRPTETDMMVKLHVVCLSCVLIAATHSSEFRLMFISCDGASWLATTLEGLLENEDLKSISSSQSYLDLCVGVLHTIVQDPECRQKLAELEAAVSIAFLLVNAMTTAATHIEDGKRRELRPSEVPPEDVLVYMLESPSVRKALKDSSEVSRLCLKLGAIEQRSEGLPECEAMKAIVRLLNSDSGSSLARAPNTSVSDLIYAGGVKALLLKMLKSLTENSEVENYSQNNLTYSTDSHVLEKYKHVSNIGGAHQHASVNM
jgi:hypothetical protein